MELKKSNRETLRHAPNSQARAVVGESEEDTATYHRDKRFLGWKLASLEYYEKKWKEYWNKGWYEERREAKKEALRKLCQRIREAERRGPAYMDRSTSDFMFAGGQPGAGKTALLRGVTNTSALSGANNFIVDPEHEYFTNNYAGGVQGDISNLRDGELARPVQTKILMPSYVKKRREENNLKFWGRQDTRVFRLSFDDLQPADFAYLLRSKLEKGSSDLDVFLMRLQQRMDDGDGPSNWGDIIDLAYEMADNDDFNYGRRAKEIEVFIETHYQGRNFFGNKANVEDWGGLFDDVNTVVLSMATGNDLDDDRLGMFELYVGVVTRILYEERKRGNIEPPFVVTGDEMHHLAPDDVEKKKHPSKQLFRRIAKKGRKRATRLNGASQEPEDIQDKNFLNLCSHFLIPRNMTDGQRSKPRKHLLKSAGVYNTVHDPQRGWDDVFEAMQSIDGLYPWLYCSGGRWWVVEPRSPIANHRQEDADDE